MENSRILNWRAWSRLRKAQVVAFVLGCFIPFSLKSGSIFWQAIHGYRYVPNLGSVLESAWHWMRIPGLSFYDLNGWVWEDELSLVPFQQLNVIAIVNAVVFLLIVTFCGISLKITKYLLSDDIRNENSAIENAWRNIGIVQRCAILGGLLGSVFTPIVYYLMENYAHGESLATLPLMFLWAIFVLPPRVVCNIIGWSDTGSVAPLIISAVIWSGIGTFIGATLRFLKRVFQKLCKNTYD